MASLLLIGPTYSSKENGIGGTTISFESLLQYVRSQNQPHQIISINTSSNKGLSAIVLLLKALWLIPRHDVVMLNVNPLGALYIAPFVYRYSLLWRKRYVFRMFGGDLIEVYQARSASGQKEMQKSIFGAHLVYLQTHRLVNFFKPFANDIRWLPTGRATGNESNSKPYERKFVFISQVMKSKGIDFVIQLAESRPDINVAIYGPILEAPYEYLEHQDYYHGVLEPKNVSAVLTKHDVLLLPTFHPGEGYPGIIIEAFAAGLPVIATNWLAIPELVQEGENGYLVQPHSFASLENAVDRITPENHATMSRQALNIVKQFDADKINTNLLRDLTSVSVVK